MNIPFFGKKKVQPEDMEQKGAGSWGKLWKLGLEYIANGGKMTRPYAQIPAVYKAVKSIIDNVPQAGYSFFDKTSEKEIPKTDKRVKPVLNLLENPNEDHTGNDFLQALVGFYCLEGETAIILIPSMGQVSGAVANGANNLPAQILTVNPRKLEKRTLNGVTVYVYGGVAYPPEQVRFIRDFNPYDDKKGMSPLTSLMDLMDTDYNATVYNKSFFKNNAMPGMALKTDQRLTPMQRNEIRQWWKTEHQGADKAFSLAILEAGLDMKTMSGTHTDMEFLEQKRYSREEILGQYRSPKALHNITDDLNYATFVGQMKIFWLYGIIPILVKVQAAINKHIVTPYDENIEMRFDLKNVAAFQEDFKEKVGTAHMLNQMGYPINMLNEKLNLGMEKVEWGDEWWMSFGLAPASDYSNDPQPPYDPNNDTDNIDDKEPVDDKKHVKSQRSFLAAKRFLRYHDPLEKKFESKTKRYFMEQRAKVIDSLVKNTGTLVMDWDAEEKKLTKYTFPLFDATVRAGVEMGKDWVGKKQFVGRKDINADAFEYRVNQYVKAKADKITNVSRTVQRKVKAGIEEAIRDGATIQDMTAVIRDIYNMASSRSLMIARTEVSGALNGGSLLYYDDIGVQKKEWSTAADENVRESHQRIEGEVVGISGTFSNGLRYPGDQASDPGETVNCRCTILPVLEN